MVHQRLCFIRFLDVDMFVWCNAGFYVKFSLKTERERQQNQWKRLTEDNEEEHTVLSEIRLKIMHSSVCVCACVCMSILERNTGCCDLRPSGGETLVCMLKITDMHKHIYVCACVCVCRVVFPQWTGISGEWERTGSKVYREFKPWGISSAVHQPSVTPARMCSHTHTHTHWQNSTCTLNTAV